MLMLRVVERLRRVAAEVFRLPVHRVGHAETLLALRRTPGSGATVEADSRADRVRAGLARLPVLFYAGLIALAWGVWLGQRTALYADPGASPLPVRLLLHSIDGIFLFHFYVEAFLWKFSKPHYRETLAPLYFGARARS